MPYDYAIYPAQNLAVVTASGRIAGAEIIATIQRMAEDGPWVEGMHQMCDYLEVTGLSVSPSEMRQIAGMEQAYFHDTQSSRLALLARGFDMRTMCELFCVLTRLRGRKARVFQSRDEAMAWLGVPAGHVHLTEQDILAGVGAKAA